MYEYYFKDFKIKGQEYKQTDKMKKKNPKQTINKMKRNKTNKPNENKLELTFILTTKQLH